MAGFPTAFGVFQEYYSSHPESLKDSTANVAVIGTTITVGPLFSVLQRNLSDYICLCQAKLAHLVLQPRSFMHSAKR